MKTELIWENMELDRILMIICLGIIMEEKGYYYLLGGLRVHYQTRGITRAVDDNNNRCVELAREEHICK